MNIRDAMTNPDLFGDLFAGDSWHAWRALLAGFYGLSLTDAEREPFQAVTGRERPPDKPSDELWMAIGRRGGKSHIAALLAVFEACFRDHSENLSPGEVATVFVVAADRRQARVVMRYVEGLIDGNPMLARMVTKRTTESVELSNRTVIEVGTCSIRALRGYTLAAAILDEIAFWYSDGAKPDREVVASIRPALATLGGPLIALSSPYARRGMLWDQYRRYYGKTGRVLVAKAPSRTMNPTLSAQIVNDALADDPAAAGAEYLAEFRKDVEEFASLEVIQACIEPGCRERPKVADVRYTAFVDPSGGSSDSFTLAIAHRERERVFLDTVREVRPPFSPESVVSEFVQLLRHYRCRHVIGDRYAGEWPREQFRKRGIGYKVSERTRSELYCDLLPLLNSQTVELLDNERLVSQLNQLERRTSRAGRDSIDHGPGGHDDLINAAAGAVVHCGVLEKKLVFPNVGSLM
ncbi:MAG: hypothetical protein HND55_08825 [Pseudomonadota bacterium]|nr:MAG: hypothetical protein HND55_08825 [Pseudomonadota bacterium]